MHSYFSSFSLCSRFGCLTDPQFVDIEGVYELNRAEYNEAKYWKDLVLSAQFVHSLLTLRMLTD